jgi:Immunity protein 49
MNSNYTPEQQKLLENNAISVRLDQGDGPIPRGVQYINDGKGSFSGCIRGLNSFHQLKATLAWFTDHNLSEFKLQAYITSKLHYIHCIEVEPQGLATEGEYCFGLLSDYEPLIRWMMGLQPSSAWGLKLINNPKDAMFRHWQMTLALRGDWQNLRERAELFLQDVPLRMKKLAVDQRFYLALSQADMPAMQATLEELISPKVAKARPDSLEYTFPSILIASHATLYAKIARRHGYEINLNTPLIPQEWLPVAALPSYEDPYEFMRKYVI